VQREHVEFLAERADELVRQPNSSTASVTRAGAM
jgi:hypothetical protein